MDTFDLTTIDNIILELQNAFDAISMSRSPYVLENLVIKEKDTEPEQWAQCVLEMQGKYVNIRRILLQIERAKIEAMKFADDDLGRIDRQLKEIDIEQMEWSLTDNMRQFFALYKIFKTFGKQYSRAELDAAQADYWYKRLTRQAHQDVLATGRISVGNQDALRQIKTVARVEDNELRFYQIGNGNKLDEPT